MPLNEKEQQLLEELNKKAKEPAAPSIGRAINVTIDMGDSEQVKKAQKWGLLPADEDEGGDEGDEGEEGDETPKRRSYFGD